MSAMNKREPILVELAEALDGIAAFSEIEHFGGIVHELRKIARKLRQLSGRKFNLPVSAVITQGEHMVIGKITGLVPGASDTFFVTPVDINGNPDALPAGSPVPTWTADDTTVTLVTAADGLSTAATAASGATVGGSFNLNWAASYIKPDGTAANITGTANVPYLAPPALLPVSGVISQGSPAAVTASARKN